MNVKPILLISAFSIAGAANAVVLTSWNFESTTVSGTAMQNVGGISASTGTGTASGHHASASTVYSTPVGNGSSKSLSSNFWTVGDYYQFTTSTTGFKNLTLDFDQAGSNTGPRDFKISYSTNGTTFTDLAGGGYSVPSGSFSSGSVNPAFAKSFNLSSLTALNNAASIYIRIVDTSTTSINGGSVGTAGTGRVDNVTISAQAVPEPTTMAVLGLGAAAMLRRRRKA